MDRMNLSSENVEIAMKIDRNDSLVLLASNEDPFWTEDQLLFLKNVPPIAFLIIGLIVSAIVICGLVANGTILFIFYKYVIHFNFQELNIPMNLFLPFLLADSNDSDHHRSIYSS